LRKTRVAGTLLLSALFCFGVACGSDEAGGSDNDDGGSKASAGSGASSGNGSGAGVGGGSTGATMSTGTGNGNADGDCLTDAEEIARGTDPNKADTDGDGFDDCKEIECVSSPTDPNEKCYACGWKHNDPGTLVSNGNKVGSVIANLDLIDQCQENVRLWDFTGGYHILFMTAAW
jgi:hypothetical protein